MADLFIKSDCINLLRDKKIIIIGDSNMRAIYKDFVCLASENKLISIPSLKRKCEKSYMNDTLVKCSTRLDQGRAFFEMRRFQKDGVHIEFLFVTRCYNHHIKELLQYCETNPLSAPDVIIMNSCLWDICRWGPNGVPEYQANMMKLMQQFNKHLPAQTLVVWTTTLPLSQKCKGGFLIKQVEFLEHTCRFDLMEANMCAHQAVVCHGYDVLDFHYYFRMQTHRRAGDGIHWTPEPIRYMTNLLLTHISLSWQKELPGKMSGVGLRNMKNNQTRFAPAAPSLKMLPSSKCPVLDAVQELKYLQTPVEAVHCSNKSEVYKDDTKPENDQTRIKPFKRSPPKVTNQNSKHVLKSVNQEAGNKTPKNAQQYCMPTQLGKSNGRSKKRGARTCNKHNTCQQPNNYRYQNVFEEMPHYSYQIYNGSQNFYEDSCIEGFFNYGNSFQPTHCDTFFQKHHKPRGKVRKHSQRARDKCRPYNVAGRPLPHH